jgi:hypothetical protein
MPRKKDGMLFEVHPTPVKGKDGRNLVYVRPTAGKKLSMKAVDEYCDKFYGLRFGELTRAMDVFLRAAAELMAQGYRIDTPIGSFAPKLALVREMTDADVVKGRDVRFDGVDYKPGKRWNEQLEKWSDGFRPVNNPDTKQLLADQEQMDRALQESLKRFNGYVTVGIFARQSGLTYYSARKQLELWTKGDNPRLLKTRRGHEYIYTEV